MWGLLVGLVGARLGYVALHWAAYRADLGGVVALNIGALSTPLGLLAGGGAASLYLRLRRLPLPLVADALAPGLALMCAFISLADLSAGSAYGAVSDLPWTIELWGARRHPTQVYELLAALLVLGVLVWAYPRRVFDGLIFWLFLLTYGAARLFLEAFRADPWLLPGGYRGVQVVGLGAVLLALWQMRWRILSGCRPEEDWV
jgi:prolipoprotein diacylglyceryltransferase